MKKTNWIALVCGIALTGLVGTTAVMAAGAVSSEVISKEVARLASPSTEKLLKAAIESNSLSNETKIALFGSKDVVVTTTTLRLALRTALQAPTSEAQKAAALTFLGGLDSSSKTVSYAGAAGVGASAKVLPNMGKEITASSVDSDEEVIQAIENRAKVVGDLNPTLVKGAVAALAEKGTIAGAGMVACQGKIDGKESGFPAEAANNALAITVRAKELGGDCKALKAAAKEILGTADGIPTLINKCGIWGGQFASCAL